jgi:hypothetical protein
MPIMRDEDIRLSLAILEGNVVNGPVAKYSYGVRITEMQNAIRGKLGPDAAVLAEEEGFEPPRPFRV